MTKTCDHSNQDAVLTFWCRSCSVEMARYPVNGADESLKARIGTFLFAVSPMAIMGRVYTRDEVVAILGKFAEVAEAYYKARAR